MRGNALFSYGEGSWRATRLWRIHNPSAELRLFFTDTLYEDSDTYRFGVQAAANVYGRKADWVPAAEDFPDYRAPDETPIEEYAGNPEWRAFLAQLRDRTADEVPELVWAVEGRDPWEIFRDERFLGNSRIDPCSKIGKRQMLDRLLAELCDPATDTLIYGIGEHEKHRFDDGEGGGIKHRLVAKGWTAQAPLIELPPHPIKDLRCELYGLAPQRLYRLGYMHANCGGFCIKAGQAHYQNRYRVHPERIAYDAMMERKLAAYLGKPVTMLREQVKGKRRALSLDTFVGRLMAQPTLRYDYEPGTGGCGCMLDEAA